MLFSLAEIYLISPYFLTIKTLVSSFFLSFFFRKLQKQFKLKGKFCIFSLPPICSVKQETKKGIDRFGQGPPQLKSLRKCVVSMALIV